MDGIGACSISLTFVLNPNATESKQTYITKIFTNGWATFPDKASSYLKRAGGTYVFCASRVASFYELRNMQLTFNVSLQIAPFDIEFSATHKELDFSHLLVS